ncbi:hypothetical protein EMWEY_00013760 [Eimeria maxima]|uniref:Uncharacterized protein n=1 Tax=Eimeria maxima TaxID=5804 RepID=U6M8V6_EIMMA|nr:hypothetical protein EMWEY_00013760 [Eimeria maxima]CDJ58080.1 hypothetical protein EMWEY_00013760 [Eimeria maxima]
MEWPRRSKRKQRGKDAVGREAKKNKLEAPIQQGLPGTSVPPLDPELDSLIDSILFEDLSVLYGDTWLLDDAITPLTPSTLESEDAAPREVFAGQQSLDAPMPTAKMPTSLLPGSVSTLDSSDPPATSPSSFFESVLSEASQSTPGLYADDWLSSGDAEVVDEALGLIDSRATPSMLLGSSGESQEGAGSRVEISAGPYKGEMYVGASSSSKRLIHDSHLDAVLEPADVSPGMSSTSTDPESGRAAGVLESSSLRSLLSSASSDHPPSGRETDVAVHSGEPAEQLTSELTRSAVKELQAAVEGFEEMLRGIPDHVLENHPFYRHPGPQLRLNWRSFSDAYAACYRTWRQNIVLLLSKCRYLLKKPWLTTEEFGELVCHTERLCGYASGFMHVDVTGPFAIESLGRAFIVLDTLHCAAEVLGQSARKDEWWPGIVRRIRDAGYIGTFDKRKLGKKPWAYPLVKALRVALDYYMMGKRPPLHLVIGLKFSLFMSSMPTDFLSSRWDPWRNDATEWLKSIKPKTQASA